MSIMTEYLTIEKFNGQFIGYVKKYPCLYDPQAEDYNNKAVTEVAWYEIARHFNMPVEKCKDKWRNIRCSYVRYKRSRVPYVKSYYLREHMEFLDPCIRTADKGYTKSRPSKRASSVDLTQEDPIENDDLSLNCSKIKFEEIIIPENRTQETNSDYTLKRSDNEKPKVPDVNEPIHDRSSTSFLESSMNNSRAMFLMSLLPEVDEMTEKRFRQFKRKILTIIDDINSQNSN